MQFADLMKLFREGQNEGRKKGYVTQGACDAEGLRAVVVALRDEMLDDLALSTEPAIDDKDISAWFDEILGDAGEKVAEYTGGMNDLSVTPATDFAAHLTRQRDFSERTFGPGERVEGVSEHIRKELVEVAGSEPGHDRQREWIDVVMLALDGAWRSGMSPEEIIEGLRFKLDINERRTWPDWRTADPNKAIEHHRNDRAPNAAPAVCVWLAHHQTRRGMLYVAQCNGEWTFATADPDCPACGKAVIFTEANHG